MPDIDYAALTQAGWDEVPEEKLLPSGHWTLANAGVHYWAPKEEGKTGQLAFFYKAKSPDGDVSPKDLKALGDYDYTQNDIRSRPFFFGNNKDKRTVLAHIKKHAGFSLPSSQPILVEEEGVLKVNPELRKALAGLEIVGKMGVDSYQGRDSNIVSDFIPVE